MEKKKKNSKSHQLQTPSPSQQQSCFSPKNTVINLLNTQLSAVEISLQEKGLTFFPRPPRLDKFQLKQNTSSFVRRLRLKEYFYPQDDDEHLPPNPFWIKSGWTPPASRDVALETYIKGITQDIERALYQEPKKYQRDNLTKEERRPLISLGMRTDIIIKKADKGSATVVMSCEDYRYH